MVAARFADQRFDVHGEAAEAGMRTARLIGQRLRAAGLVAFASCRDRLTRGAIPFGDLTSPVLRS